MGTKKSDTQCAKGAKSMVEVFRRPYQNSNLNQKLNYPELRSVLHTSKQRRVLKISSCSVRWVEIWTAIANQATRWQCNVDVVILEHKCCAACTIDHVDGG